MKASKTGCWGCVGIAVCAAVAVPVSVIAVKLLWIVVRWSWNLIG